MSRRIALIAVFLLIAAACGGDDATPTTTGAPGTTQPGAETTTAETQATTTTEPQGDPFVPGVGLGEVTLTTPTSGSGPRPTLSWEPVEGASAYTVVVFDAEGTAWWSWQGDNTEVVLGGIATDTEIGGPRAGEGVTWVVFAYDVENQTIAVSELRSIEE